MITAINNVPHNENPGIVPPWLSGPTTPPVVKNPGIVPPWLQDGFHILPITGETQFVREPANHSPMSLVDALRAR